MTEPAAALRAEATPAQPPPTPPAPPGSARGTGGRRAAARAAAALALGAAVVVAVAAALRGQDWSVGGALLTPRGLGLAALAFLVNSVAMVLSMVAWRALLVDLGGPVSTVESARIFFVGFLTKFVPGRFWPLVANIRMGASAGVGAARMATVYVLTMAISILTGLTVGLVAAPALSGGQAWALLLAATPVVLLMVRPGLTNRAAAALARVLRRPAPAVTASDAGVRRSIVAQTGCWLAAGAQLWLLAVAQGAPAARALPVSVGAFALGTVAGVAAVLVPDGIGVREGILLLALTTVLPVAAAGVVVVASRLVCTLSEIAVACGASLASEVVRRRRHH